jgi:hypothetical protein
MTLNLQRTLGCQSGRKSCGRMDLMHGEKRRNKKLYLIELFQGLTKLKKFHLVVDCVLVHGAELLKAFADHC